MPLNCHLLLDATAVAAAAAAKMSLCFDAEMHMFYTNLFISTYDGIS